DTGGGRDEHGDLPHGVPGTDVHEGDVDDVAAVAVLVRLLGEVDGDRHVDAGAGRDHRQPAGHEPDDGAERGAPPAGGHERAVGEVGGQPAQDEDEHDERDRLDEHLRQGEVGRAVELVEQRHPVAGDAEQQHGLEPAAGTGGEEGGDGDDGDDGCLDPAVPHPHVVREGGERERGATAEGDRGDEDGGQVGGQRAALGEGGDVRGEALG